MMQPGTTAAPPQYQQQPPHHPSQQWPPQKPLYQVPPPQQPPAAAYYYQQPQAPDAAQQYAASHETRSQTIPEDGIRTLWIGDLHFWMDEQYLYSCFGAVGEVVAAKVIRNKQSYQSEGYGFIEFASHVAAERSLQTLNGTLMPSVEQTFRLNWASMGAREKRVDAPEYTIFVGDLAADVTDYMLQETFRANYPSVKGAKVVSDRITGRTKGYGFVMFGDESEQLRAMTEMNGRFCSTRPMRVGPAANKQRVGGGPTKGSYQTSQGTPSEDDPSNTTIFVGNLDANVTDDHLRQVFGQYGQLVHVKIPVGKHCGFVKFSDRSCAEEALRLLNGTPLEGQNLRLSWGRSPANKLVLLSLPVFCSVFLLLALLCFLHLNLFSLRLTLTSGVVPADTMDIALVTKPMDMLRQHLIRVCTMQAILDTGTTHLHNCYSSSSNSSDPKGSIPPTTTYECSRGN